MSGRNHAELIWKIADLLRGPYRPKEYGQVILPFTVLRRMDCVLAGTKDAVLTAYARYQDSGVPLTAVLPQVGEAVVTTTRRATPWSGSATRTTSGPTCSTTSTGSPRTSATSSTSSTSPRRSSGSTSTTCCCSSPASSPGSQRSPPPVNACRGCGSPARAPRRCCLPSASSGSATRVHQPRPARPARASPRPAPGRADPRAGHLRPAPTSPPRPHRTCPGQPPLPGNRHRPLRSPVPDTRPRPGTTRRPRADCFHANRIHNQTPRSRPRVPRSHQRSRHRSRTGRMTRPKLDPSVTTSPIQAV